MRRRHAVACGTAALAIPQPRRGFVPTPRGSQDPAALSGAPPFPRTVGYSFAQQLKRSTKRFISRNLSLQFVAEVTDLPRTARSVHVPPMLSDCDCYVARGLDLFRSGSDLNTNVDRFAIRRAPAARPRRKMFAAERAARTHRFTAGLARGLARCLTSSSSLLRVAAPALR